jgi:RNA polymerase sigma factor (sigma-70 family)
MNNIDLLMKKYENLVCKIAKRFYLNNPNGLDFGDYKTFGMVGLWKAIQNFDENKKVKFITFASLNIEWNIKIELRKLHHIGNLDLKKYINKELPEKKQGNIKNKFAILYASPTDFTKRKNFFINYQTPEQIYIEKEKQRERLNKIHKLPKKQREAMLYYVFEGKSNTEIGNFFSCTKQYIQKNFHKGKEKLNSLDFIF